MISKNGGYLNKVLTIRIALILAFLNIRIDLKLNAEEPTCIKTGGTYKLCSCGDVIDEVIIPAKGHSEALKKVVGEEPALEKVGYYNSICPICNEAVEKRISENFVRYDLETRELSDED